VKGSRWCWPTKALTLGMRGLGQKQEWPVSNLAGWRRRGDYWSARMVDRGLSVSYAARCVEGE
jgi:hypothetical protein